MANEFTLYAKLQATPETIYQAWLDSAKHGAMTGGPAKVSDQPGGAFTAWDGYITGNNVELVPYSKIVQSWRTTDFSTDEADSTVEILLEERDGLTLLTLTHSQLPPHGDQYKQGWVEHYFEPMEMYFLTGKPQSPIHEAFPFS